MRPTGAARPGPPEEVRPRDAAASPPPEPSPPAAQTSAERPRRRPPRKLSTALQRLDRELKQVRTPPSAPTDGNAAAGSAAAASQAGQGRAHIEQLLRMRSSAMAQKQTSAKNEPVSPADEFRMAQEALRDQQYGRAHEHLRKACEAEPDNEVYAMFGMWAAFRANTLSAEGINKLRTALRGKVSDDLYKGFAYYALGHISLAEKKDDSAEKFFRKAIELDKNNKDAERHMRIIELRRKTAASEQRAGKIFGIEIGIKKS
jgi:tetratricopeptide (TPR) repeat protein